MSEQHESVGRSLRAVARPAPHPRKYEMMIVVAPTVTEDGLPNVVERVTGYLETHGGTIESFTHDSPWGRRRLAYPIQNFRDAFYVLFYFHIEPRVIDELDREIRLDEAVIRHLIVRYDPLTERVAGIEQVEDDDSDEDELRDRRPRARPERPSPVVADRDAGGDAEDDVDDEDDSDDGEEEDENA
jgi:small subunit ribosomal protein S6